MPHRQVRCPACPIAPALGLQFRRPRPREAPTAGGPPSLAPLGQRGSLRGPRCPASCRSFNPLRAHVCIPSPEPHWWPLWLGHSYWPPSPACSPGGLCAFPCVCVSARQSPLHPGPRCPFPLTCLLTSVGFCPAWEEGSEGRSDS